MTTVGNHPKGVGLYVRRIERRHGSPASLAKYVSDAGLDWIAIGGPWHQVRKDGQISTGLMNRVEVCQEYAAALEARGVRTFVWGYPWLGTYPVFVEQIVRCAAASGGRVLLDPELGANPTRSKKAADLSYAEKGVEGLIRGLKLGGATYVGFSTFGTGVRLKWFPILAFAKELRNYFPGAHFIGGQTYTNDKVIDLSIDQFSVLRAQVGSSAGSCAIVPNFGLYKWEGVKPNRKAIPKTPDELRAHLWEFINEGEPVDAVIGWAENFIRRSRPHWRVLSEFSDMMKRGATALPR